MFELLREDINRAMQEARTDPNWKPSWEAARNLLPAFHLAGVAYRYGHWARGVRIPVVGTLLRISRSFFPQVGTELFTSVHIDVQAEIGPGFVIHSVYAINLGTTNDWRELHHRHGMSDFACVPRHRR